MKSPLPISRALFAALVLCAPAQAQCQNKLLAGSATAQDQFGVSIDLTARYVVVGAHFEAGSGAAYVYEPSGIGFSQSARLEATLPTGTDQFGFSVSTSRETVLVGAPFSHFAPQNFTGSAHVFTRHSSGWIEDQVLRASDVHENDQFGFCVDVHADRIAIGAPLRDQPSMPNAGAVYLFEQQGTSWIEVDILTASDAEAEDFFGLSVSLSGDTLLIGAPFEDEAGSSAGAAYVFQFDGTSWVESQKLLSSTPDVQDEFGRAVAVVGDTAAIAARNDDDGGPDAGAVYVFREFGGNWLEFQKLKAVVPAAADRFGSTVAIAPGKIAVGSPFHNTPNADRGSAHLFTSNGGGWTETLTLSAFDAADFDRFGSAVAVNEEHVLVGAPYNDEAASNAGAVYDTPIAGPDCNGNGVLDACEPSPYRELCFGDGGNGLGCTNCPCGNNSVPGSCSGCLNGTGQGARILPSGAPTVVGDTMRVDMTGGNPQTFALLVSGDLALPKSGANPCFELASGVLAFTFDGLRCAGGGTVRHGIRPIDVAGEVGTLTAPWGEDPYFVARAGFVAGQSRIYQAYYRELPTLVCGRGLNTSQAFSVTFLP